MDAGARLHSKNVLFLLQFTDALFLTLDVLLAADALQCLHVLLAHCLLLKFCIITFKSDTQNAF